MKFESKEIFHNLSATRLCGKMVISDPTCIIFLFNGYLVAPSKLRITRLFGVIQSLADRKLQMIKVTLWVCARGMAEIESCSPS